MSKRIFCVLISIIWLSVAGISASAQSELPKFELGVQITASPATAPNGPPVFIVGEKSRPHGQTAAPLRTRLRQLAARQRLYLKEG